MFHRRKIRQSGGLGGVFKVSGFALIAIIALGIYDFILPLFINSFEVNATTIGAVISLTYLISFFMEFPAGMLIESLGRVKLLMLSTAAIGLLGIIYTLIPSITLVFVIGIIFGAITVFYYTPTAALVRDYSPPKETAKAQGIYLTFAQLGWIIGPIIAGILIVRINLKFNFLIFAALFFIASVYAVILLRDSKHLKKKRVKFESPLSIIKEYAKLHKMAIPIFILSLIMYTWIAAQWVFIQLAGIEIFSFPESLIGLILGTMMIVDGIIFFASGYLMDRVGKKAILLGGFFVLFTGSFYIFTLRTPQAFIFFLMITAAAIAWSVPGIEAMLTDITPKNRLGIMTGLFDGSHDLGFVIAPIVGGILIDFSGDFLMPFLMIAVLAIVGLAISFFLPNDKGKASTHRRGTRKH